MTTTKLQYIFEISGPWITVGMGELERKKWIPSFYFSRPEANMCVRKLRGQKMRTKQSLMDEFAAALQFFEGFGENWDALGECLEYMDEWLPADVYLLVVEQTGSFFGRFLKSSFIAPFRNFGGIST